MHQNCHPRPSGARGRGPRYTGLGLVAAVCLIPFVGRAHAAGDVLSDAELVARANAVMSVKDAPADRILGLHKGTPVIVDVRCGDVCPQYTVRIIHYVVEPGPACTALHGDTASIPVPVSIAVRPQSFCIPHVLYSRKLYADHPFQ